MSAADAEVHALLHSAEYAFVKEVFISRETPGPAHWAQLAHYAAQLSAASARIHAAPDPGAKAYWMRAALSGAIEHELVWLALAALRRRATVPATAVARARGLAERARAHAPYLAEAAADPAAAGARLLRVRAGLLGLFGDLRDMRSTPGVVATVAELALYAADAHRALLDADWLLVRAGVPVPAPAPVPTPAPAPARARGRPAQPPAPRRAPMPRGADIVHRRPDGPPRVLTIAHLGQVDDDVRAVAARLDSPETTAEEIAWALAQLSPPLVAAMAGVVWRHYTHEDLPDMVAVADAFAPADLAFVFRFLFKSLAPRHSAITPALRAAWVRHEVDMQPDEDGRAAVAHALAAPTPSDAHEIAQYVVHRALTRAPGDAVFDDLLALLRAGVFQHIRRTEVSLTRRPYDARWRADYDRLMISERTESGDLAYDVDWDAARAGPSLEEMHAILLE